MKFLLLFLPLFWLQSVKAQDSWTVCFNDSDLVTAKAEDVAATRIQLSTKELKKKSSLKVTYTELPVKSTWQRSLIVVNSKDKELIKSNGSSLTISNARLASLLKAEKTLRIFTWALPKDPEERARVRVRRVLLCTITQTPS